MAVVAAIGRDLPAGSHVTDVPRWCDYEAMAEGPRVTGLAKQAKILTDAQTRAALAASTTPDARAMFLLSVKAGLRACEIANLTWPMVCDAQGEISDIIALRNSASKGKKGGRAIPMHEDIRDALAALDRSGANDFHAAYVVHDSRGKRMTPNGVAVRLRRLYLALGFEGCSSHSGRRTFLTKAACKIVEAGGSMRDVQQLAGHSSLSTTQGYIEGSSDAKRRVVAMI